MQKLKVEQTKRIEVRLSNTLLDALKKTSKELNVTSSKLIRDSLMNHLEELKTSDN